MPSAKLFVIPPFCLLGAAILYSFWCLSCGSMPSTPPPGTPTQPTNTSWSPSASDLRFQGVGADMSTIWAGTQMQVEECRNPSLRAGDLHSS